MNYDEFLERKTHYAGKEGFKPVYLPDYLFDFQKEIVEWAVEKGRAAIFADCGLGKTPMQLVWAENVARYANGGVLILTPLTEVLVNLTGRVQEVAAEHGIDYTTVHTGTLKKWACGAGNADKGAMMDRAGTYLGRKPIDDNEADAVLMAMYAWSEYGEPEGRKNASRFNSGRI